MSSSAESVPSPARHRGPPLGLVAAIFTVLFNLGLYFVVSFRASGAHFPGPGEPAAAIVAFFRDHAALVRLCAFFHFGSAIALGVFAATAASRLRFLGVRAAGATIALCGGLATALAIAASASVLWTMAVPGVAQDPAVLRALYYLQFAVGGVGFSVPLGLLMAGISIPAAFLGLLPKWIVVLGLVLAAAGELSSLEMLFPAALFLIPLTRFPGFVWLIAAGLKLPVSAARSAAPAAA
jgi:hypothetical protein